MYSAERQFVTTAHSQLRLLEQDEHHAHPVFEDALLQIKNAAGPVKARAIYRGALLCEDVLKRCDTAACLKFQTSLNSLKSLVELYADGLYEIDPSFLVVEAATTEPKNAPIASNGTSDETAPEHMNEHITAENENAASLLKPLLHLVKDDKQAGALSFLAGVEHQSEITVTAPQPKLRSNVRFDSLMRRITNRTLGEARAQAKNISISYAADFETVDTSISADLQGFLQATCLEIVRCGLVVNGDLAASINRTWQISITGETRGQELSISLSWLGEQLLDFSSSGKGETLLQSLNGKLAVHCEQNKIENKRDMHVLELTCPLRKSEKSKAATIDVQQPKIREA